ncbi:NAD(P)-binding protein [Neisseriaceae bacterium PsAf]|nr:NAD(P)-binding protein [Neisseriaceae bacterium PsAf]
MKSSGNIYQFIDLPRVEAPKKTLEERKGTFNEIYHIFSETQAQSQADRCLACGNPYCQHKCPVNNNIPNWLKLVYEGRIIEAAELSLTNILPEICVRVCPQDRLCEGSCTINDEYGAVTIGGIEKYITETAFEMGWKPQVIAKEENAKKVAVVGYGPAGLACADFLNRNGVRVTVYERQPEIGGLLTFGIPAFKLEKEVLIRRREIFQELGIEFQLNTEIGKDISLTELENQYDAIFLGTGTYQGMMANIPREYAKGVYSALPFLISNTEHLMGFESDNYVSMQDKKVVVLGGGDTAMDCVRTSIRQQAASVHCVYRRDAENMPCSKKEFHNAQEEGVEFIFNAQPVAVVVNEQNEVTGIQVTKTQLGEPDEKGRRRAEIIPNSETTISCDAIIIAFGFTPHAMPWLNEVKVTIDEKGRIIANNTFPHQTNNPKFFAGGDITRGSDLVVTAVLEGRNAAFSIMDFLTI